MQSILCGHALLFICFIAFNYLIGGWRDVCVWVCVCEVPRGLEASGPQELELRCL